MADDITLTVRVRDMTRGEFAQIRQRMHGMDGDLRRMARSTSGASAEAARMSRNIQDLSGRLQQMHSAGGGARSEMVHMRRTLGLLGRELRIVGRDSDMTEDEFRSLSRQLERTRLDFDHLARDIERHSAVANRAARDESQRQAASQRMGVLQARAQRESAQRIQRMGQLQARAQREEQQRILRMGQLQAQAQRENQQRDAARQQQIQRMGVLQARAQRDEANRVAAIQRAATAQQMAAANQQFRNAQRIARAHTAALQEEARRQAAIQQGESDRLRRTSGAPALNLGGDSSGALRGMSSGLQNLQRVLQGISGSSANARRNIQLFNGDMNAMSRILQSAQDSGSISRQDFDDLATGMRLADQNMRDLRRSGDLSRGSFRAMRRDVAALRAQLSLLGGEGGRFNLINSRLLLLRRNLRDTSNGAGIIRRAFSRLGDWGLGGLMRMNAGLGALAGAVIGLGRRFAATTRFMKMFLLVMLLIAPAAQALGAILVAALGGAFIALGAFALRGNAEVKSAFQDMKSTVSSTVKEAALPMKSGLVVAIRNVGTAAREMQPMLTRAFAATGPLVDDIFGAVTGFASAALPGLTTALEHSREAMVGFRQGMTLMGKGLGDMFAIITKGNEKELSRAWVVLGNEIRNALESLGQFMSTTLNSGTASMLLIGVFRTFTGALNVMAAALDTVDMVFGSLFTTIADGISNFGKGQNAMADFYNDSGKSVKDLKKDLADLDEQISKTQGDENMPSGVKESVLSGLQSQRATILEAIAAKEDAATAATLNHAKSVAELIKQIQSLADLNRAYLDAESAQEAAIDAAVEGYGKYAGALKKTNGQWDLSNKAAQEAYGLLSKIAQTTKEATDKAIESNAPWEHIRSNWQQGYDEIVRLGDGMNMSSEDARALAAEIMGIPPTKELFFKARTEEAKANLDSVIAAFQAAPGEKLITVKALGQDAISLLRAIGFTVTQLPDGQFQITAQTADAKRNIGLVQAARDGLKGKSIAITIPTDPAVLATYTIQAAINAMTGRTLGVGVYTTEYYTKVERGGNAIGASTSIPGITKNAKGSLLSFFADGGMKENHVAQIAPRGSWRVWAEDEAGDEAYIPLASNKRPRSRQIAAETVDRLGGSVQWFAKGGNTKASAAAKARRDAAAKAQRDAQRDAQGELRGQLGVSRFASMAGLGTSSMREGLGRPSDLASLVSTLSALGNTIKKAFSGGKESSLLKQLDRTGRALIKYEKKLEGVNKRLDAAKDKLNDLRQEANSLRESVKSGVMSATSITGAAGGGGKTLTVSDLMTQLTQGRDKASAFANALKELRSKGVSKEIIGQIAEAGISGGGMETAGALLTASQSEIASMNQLQKQINASAKAAGDSAAGAMFNAGIKAAEGLVKGLTKQKKTIEKAMMDIAKSMEKAIKRALGIKSPSTVMQEVGHFTAEGFSVGMRKNSSPHQAWDSMLNTTPSTGRAGGGGTYGGSGAPNVFHIYIGDKKVDEVILDSNRRTVRTHGGNVQSTYGRRNG